MAEGKWSTGMFVWRELMTDDPEGATRFYGELFGWTWKVEDMGPPGRYWMAHSGGRPIGGVMAKSPGSPMPTAWSSYVLVDDVDAATGRCVDAGGRVLRAPADIPDVGRFSILADPWDAVSLPYRPFRTEAPPPSGRPPPGTFCWETLVTPQPADAAVFYGKVVGLGTAPSPNGEGSVFTAADGSPVADVRQAQAERPSYWSTYVAVADAQAARERAAALGGKVIVPRVDVPKIGIVAAITDPGGAALGLFQATGG